MPTRADSRIGRLLGMFIAEGPLCFQMLFWRIWLPLLKYAVPFHVLVRLMWGRPRRSASARARQDSRVRAVERLLQNGGRLLVSGNCLERSLMIYRLLSTIGANPNLVLGVSRQEGVVSGHSWVELDGRVVNDQGFRQFQPVAAFGHHGRLRSLAHS